MPFSRSSASRSSAALIAGLVLVSAGFAAPPAVASPIAVVVGPGVGVDDLTFSEARRIMTGERQFWSPGQPITLIVRAPEAPERAVLLRQIYKMSEAQFRQHWIAKVFRAEATAGPMITHSNQEAVDLLGVMRGAIALVDSGDVPEGMRMLKIDGKRPGDPGYPFN